MKWYMMVFNDLLYYSLIIAAFDLFGLITLSEMFIFMLCMQISKIIGVFDGLN